MNKIHLVLFATMLSLLVAPSLAIYSAGSEWWKFPSSCPIGQYPACSLNSDSLECSKCPVGTSGNGYTAVGSYYYNNNNYGCQQCQSGFYMNETGSASCLECPEGSQCPNPTTGPMACPKGSAYSSVWTAASYWPSNSVCTRCPENTYANKVGSIQCMACPSGRFCPDPAADPQPCPKGTATDMPNNMYGYYYGYYGYYGYPYYYPNMNELRCQPCPPGFYAPSTGLATCLLCPDGSYCPDPTQAIPCPKGTSRINFPYFVTFPRVKLNYPAHYSFCPRCPQGYYANLDGSKTCTKCPKGYYCSDPTASPKPCPAGTFASSEYGQQQCFPCPDGYYSNSTSARCTKCPDGSYCSDPSIAPRKCPPGSFSNSTMVKISCARCPPGTYTTMNGTISCNMCPDSMCCDNPSAEPTSCYKPPMYTTAYMTS